ncbi:MAG: hypothetical protein OSJ59_05850 [Lachnospiraceae bacterium]|nr:hypothetical protein [Lachnospiraceae bacterium]
MYRNWKSAAALGLAVLLGCMMPMSTMLAAEEDAETTEASVPENDAFHEEENVSGSETVTDEEGMPDDETVTDEEGMPDDETVTDEEGMPGDETVTDEEGMPSDETVTDEEGMPDDETVTDEEGMPGDENVSDGESVDGIRSADIMTVPASDLSAESDSVESAEAPEIFIKRGDENKACSLGGAISLEYMGYQDTLFDVSVGGSDSGIPFYCHTDKVTDVEAGAKTEDQMGTLFWGQKETSPISIMPNKGDGCYVAYVKVEAGGQTYYARSNGIVVDTKKPVIKGVEEGKTYPEGTLFQVEDANLDKVLVNEQEAAPENGSYKVAANGTSCVIRAIDKAGHESTCSITVSGTVTPKPEEPKPEEPKPEEPKPETGYTISKSGEYELKVGVKYHLAEGKWKVDGDKSVYQGGRDFYVPANGSYQFSK